MSLEHHSYIINMCINYFLLEQLRNGRPILESGSKNISLRVGESATLTCTSRNTRHTPQVTWLKLNKPEESYRLQNLEFTKNDIKSHTLTGKGKEYELIGAKNKGEAVSVSVRARIQRGKNENSYEFRLRLENVKEADSGVYVCLVKNKHGSDYRKISVHVKSMKGKGPTFKLPPPTPCTSKC